MRGNNFIISSFGQVLGEQAKQSCVSVPDNQQLR